ncbi:Hsp70 family protein [Motilimonas pumila]|uniref:Molecular chaperone HscC n=1 Tax=Motilimonas pumila TaxID=2303987 RepID=A0A418YE66_9GAMM|nr:molecular chaperone HscC [Motilimonas pumila]RJG42798.1 molecular chaperone HscC [Motilimonas pumila]
MAIIGIDLGTTNSAAAVWQHDKSVLIPNRYGEFLTPSVVGIDQDGELIVGKYAKSRQRLDPASCASTFKRFIASDNKVKLGQYKYSAIELSAMVLKSIKEDAENFLGEPVSEAIISVPAYFNDIQRKATKAAAEMVGLKVERLINEPTAAALAYGLHEKPEDAQFVILDLGGGTFDVSLMEYFDGVLEVHASAGDNYLGGEDFLQTIVDLYLSLLGTQEEALSRQQKRTLLNTLEAAKHTLSEEQAVEIPGFLADDDPAITITRKQFEQACQPLLSKVQHPIERALKDADIMPDDIDDVILVGGATRMQILRSMIARLFQKMPAMNLDPDLTIALGAGIQAGLKEKHQALDDVVLTDVCPYSLGTNIINHQDEKGDMGDLFSPIIERNCVVPISMEKRYQTANNNQTKVQIDIYQGESRLVKNNIKLGQVEVKVPKGPAGKESVDVRFSYDMNGLLEVDVTVASTELKQSIQVQNAELDLSEQELNASSERLAALKFHPRDHEVNKELLAKAERLYESALEEERDELMRLMGYFEQELASQLPKRIERAQQEFSRRLSGFEKNSIF